MIAIIKYFSILVFYAAGCCSLGALFIHLFYRWKNREANYSALALAGTSFLIGQGLLCNLWIILAVLTWFQPAVIWSCLIVSILGGGWLFIRFIPGVWLATKNVLIDIRKDTWGWQTIFGSVAILGLSGLTTIGRALAWDAVNFYYFLPRVIAYSGNFPYFPNKGYYNYMGVLGEMNFAALISIGMEDKSRLFGWLVAIAGALFLGLICKKIGLGRRGLIIAWALFFTSSAIIYVMGDGKGDLFPLATGIAAIYWALQIRGQKDVLEICLTGMLAGFAIISKLVYLPPLFLVCALIVLQPWLKNFSWKDPQNRRRLVENLLITLLIAAGCILLVFIPNLIKNYSLVGTLFPYNPEVTKIFMNWNAGLGGSVSQHMYISYPLFLSFGENRAGQLGDISPLLFAFLPLAVFLPKPRSWLDSRLTFIVVGSGLGITLFVLLFPVVIVPRYLFPSLLALFPLAAGAAEYVTLTEKKPRFLSAAIMASLMIVVAGSFFYYLNNFFFPRTSWLYVTDQLSDCELGSPWPGEYNNMSYRCRSMEKLNQIAAPSERVFISANHYYWLRPDLVLCANRPEDYVAGSPGDSVWKMMASRGFRYVLIDDAYPYGFRSSDLNNPPGGVKTEKLYAESTVSVYSVAYPPDFPQPTVRCERDSHNQWVVNPIQ